ncbi:MAG: bifunctional UDP-sugar hydrolase/5'-nucleotidase [candidate division WOR-3 bacterium]
MRSAVLLAILGSGLIGTIAWGRTEAPHLYVVFTNDIHGGLAPSEGFWLNADFPPPIGNAAAAMTVIREKRAQARAKGYGFLFFDLGDMFSGTPIGEFSRGRAVVEFLNRCSCDVQVPGNHDFDLGETTFVNLTREARAPFVCANIVLESTDSHWPVVLPDTIFAWEPGAKPLEPRQNRYSTRVSGSGSGPPGQSPGFPGAGIKVGVFGLLTHYMKGNSSEASFGGLDVERHYVAAEREVRSLRARGADIVIAATHIGFSHDRNLADSVPGMDVIIGGHSHTGLREPVEFGRYHTICTQTYGRLTSVGFLDLEIEPETRKIAGYRGELIELSSDEILSDTSVQRFVAEWQSRAEAGFDRVVGQARRRLTRGNDESPMGNLMADALREACQADIAVTSGARGILPQGDVTWRDIYATDPFGNTAVTMTMTGQQVRAMLEVGVNGHHALFQVSGIRLVYDPALPIGHRILSVEVNGQSLDSLQEYRVATNSYLAAGAGEYGVFTVARDIEDTYTELRTILADYVGRHSPVDARIEGRIRIRTR